MPEVFQHPTALVETSDIGRGTRIWANVHILPGVVIGEDCNICDNCMIESGVTIGRGVTIKMGVALVEGVHLADGVFLGPHAVFTNDLRPRSARLLAARDLYATKKWLQPTQVDTGATVGANVTVVCGITIGAWAFVGAGATVVESVAPFCLVAGNPARAIGHVCVCAQPIAFAGGEARCDACERRYRLHGATVEPLDAISLFPEAAGERR